MIQSLNFRLADALPQAVLERWRIEFETVPKPHASLHPEAPVSMPANPKTATRRPAGKTVRAALGQGHIERHRSIELRRRIEEYLDAGLGDCWLRQPEIARLVEATLLRFDPERYRLLAWCVMPNHVHALIETSEGWPLAGILHSWKSFTGSRANELLGRRGEFWQREYLDRYVRNEQHYKNVLAYIEENPVKAGLAQLKTNWPWSSARFRAINVGIGGAGTAAGA